MTITSHPYSGEDDYAHMRALLFTLCAESGSPLYCTVGDLDWWRYKLDDPARPPVRLWFDERGILAGFTWLNNRGEVDLIVHPRYRVIEDEMLAQAEHKHGNRQADTGQPTTLTAWAYTHDDERHVVLRRRGYKRTETNLCHRGQRLDEPVSAAVLPAGYRIRSVRGEGDVEERVAVHRDAFAPSHMTAAKQRAIMQSPTYRSDLDLVVVEPNGAFAAFCIVWFDAVNKIGVFEPVGTHSAHRRLGLATALLHEGMRRLRMLNARTAYLTSDGDPGAVAATQLYESVGFSVIDRNYAWTKTP